jgi:hypothetical protein
MWRLFLLLTLLATSCLASEEPTVLEEDAVLQKTVTAIIFQTGTPVITDPTRQQVECIGRCSVPSKISCTNQGWDGAKFIWGCESLTDRRFEPEFFVVQCKRVDGEGEDVRILRNSCSLIVQTVSLETVILYAIVCLFVLLAIVCVFGGPDAGMMLFCIFFQGAGGGGGGKSFGGSSYV